MRFKITQMGEDALRGIGKLGDAECARREVANVLLEVVQLSHDKTVSLEREWERWCEEQTVALKQWMRSTFGDAS